MGNVTSLQPADGQAGDAPGAKQHALEVSLHGPSKMWAVTDHTLSGPWSFLVKEEVQCLCEGGRNCTRENPARQREPNAVPGLHSNWVGGSVLAMARPWQEHVVKHDLVNRFRELNFGMILNLQEVGEHDSCGPGNLASCGFSYDPEAFMAGRVAVYNLSWRDMGVPSLDKMMDIVQVMQYTTAVEGRRVAVHCHAGLGRTGLAIACFLVASGQAASAAAAVKAVRAARPGALQTQAQVLFVSIFEQYLAHLRCLFKVADLRHLSLGNTNYVVTKVCRRISRSMSGSHHAASGLASAAASGTPDALAAAAAAALGPLAIVGGASGSGGSSSTAPGSATSAAAASAAQQPDWTVATYDVMTPAEAAALPSAAEAAAALGSPARGGGGGGVAGGARDGLVMHARRLSGGGSLKLVSNLRAIDEEGDKPVHVIKTDNAVTEVYGHGLTIIRATDSAKKLYAGPAGQLDPEQRLREQLLTVAELGLDKQLPWNDRFAIRPEAFRAEGWLPDPPTSYLGALRRQQRLLHGAERRRCLHLHKLLRAAGKALMAAAQAYNAVPPHTDPSSVACAAAAQAASALSPTASIKRMHTRSRSNAAAIDLLAVAAAAAAGGMVLSPTGTAGGGVAGGGGGGHHQQQQQQVAGGGGAVAAAAAAAGSLLSKQQQQQQQGPFVAVAGGGGGGGGGAAATMAAALLPGIHLGPPGMAPVAPPAAASSNTGGSPASSEGRRLSRSSSNSKAGIGRCSASAPAPQPQPAAGAAVAPGQQQQPAGCAAVTPCLDGCCAPSFAVGLLIALLYRGRFPEELEAQWAACPRLKALGLDEGHAVCQALQDVKLAANAGSYGPLEAASGAVAVCVLSDWFEGFTCEALGEATLELLVDEAENMLAQALVAAAAARRKQQQQQQQQQQQHGQCSGPAGSCDGGRCGQLPPLQQPQHAAAAPAAAAATAAEAAPPGRAGAAAHGGADADDEALARRAEARGVCGTLAPHEQDLFLVLTAVLRHARFASLDDSRLGAQAGGNGAAGAPLAPAAAVEAQADAAMAVLYRLAAGWLLGPLAAACLPALEAVAAFLHYLAVDDVAYGCLLQVSQQGVRKAHSAQASKAAKEWGLQAGGGAGLQSAPSSPRAGDRLNKLKLRLLGASCGGGGSVTSSSTAPGDAGCPGGAAGRSKLSHASSSPELSSLAAGQACGGQQQQQQPGTSTRGAAPLAAAPSKSRLGSRTLGKLLGEVAGGGPQAGTAPSSSSSSKAAGAAAGGAAPESSCAKGAVQRGGLCGHGLSHLLAGRLHSRHRVQQQAAPPGDGDADGGPAAPQPASACAPVAAGLSGASSLGDDGSEVVAAGMAQELCVGRQLEMAAAAAAATAAAEARPAHLHGSLGGQQQQQQQQLVLDGDDAAQQHPGVLDSLPQSQSPEPPSPTSVRQPGRRRSSGARHHHQHQPQACPLPALQHRVSGAAASGGSGGVCSTVAVPRAGAKGPGSEGGCSSLESSPCNSMGSIVDLLQAVAKQQHGEQQRRPQPGAAQAAAATPLQAAAAAPGACLTADASGADVASSQALSVSALSELQLRASSITSTVSRG